MEIGVREMSLNRRRWSNDLLDSLIDFQNRTSSELDDSFNKSKGEEDLLTVRCTTNVDSQSSEGSSSRIENDEVSMPTMIFTNSEASDRASSNNVTMEIREKRDPVNTNLASNHNNRIIENITVSSDGTAKFFSCDSSNNQLTVDTQSIKSQSSQYSCEVFHEAVTFTHEITQNKENPNSQACETNQSHEKKDIVTEKNRLSMNLIAFEKQGEMTHRFFSSPVEFPNLDKEQIGEIDHPDIWDALLELDQALSPFAEDEENSSDEKQPTPNILNRLSQKFKKTPSRFTEKLISILEDSVISIESPTKCNAANSSGISLKRITGEFRKLCKFIEDESMPEWAPSMANMTALCAEKTETPEGQKGQRNAVCATPKNMIRHIQDTPTPKSTPLALKAFFTPKNKIRSRNQTPIKQFTPSADKSFEYWETICNMMCNPSSVEKIKRKAPPIQEDPKLSMDEMLTICERQMASLDDSTVEVRTSEPCKKTDSEIKLKVLQAPRSKSVSKMYESCEKTVKSSSKKREIEEKIGDRVVENSKESDKEENVKEEKLVDLNNTLQDTVIMTDSDTMSSDSSFLKRRLLDDQDYFKADSDDMKASNENSFGYDCELLRKQKSDEQQSFENEFKLIDYSPQERQSKTHLEMSYYPDDPELLRKQKLNEQQSFENEFKLIDYSPQERQSKTHSEMSYDPDDPDCSLIAELAMRRQRCLETAKLMMEIDQEDPMTDNNDKTCVETLYKLGIQDKTIAEVEEDTKFLNTLNQCLEYRNYFSEKKKPIIKALQKFDTPEELKKRTTSIIRSQSQVSAKKPPNKAALQRTNSAKTLNDRKMTPRLAPSVAVSKVTPRINRTSSNLRATPRISANTPRVSVTTPRVFATTPRVSATTPRVPATTPRVSATTPRVSATTPRISAKVSATMQRLATPRVMTTTPKPMPRSTSKLTPQVTKRTLYPQSEQSKGTSKLTSKTPHSLQKPMLRRPILRLSPKTTQKLTPPSELKPCTPRPAQKLTPPSELKVCTPRPPQKLTPPSETKLFTKPTPKRVANLKSPDEVTTSPKVTPRPRFFVSPGKSPSVVIMGRKKPTSYFTEKATKNPLNSHKFNQDVKSPIGLYINSVDNDLIKNVHAKTNDRLLTPVSYGETGKSPRLKIRLSAKENQSPTICNENIVLPMVRYQSARNVHLIDKKTNYSPNSITQNSRTKKLLEPIENTVIICHEGRVVEANSNPNYLNAETSIRVQKIAEKTTPRRKYVE